MDNCMLDLSEYNRHAERNIIFTYDNGAKELLKFCDDGKIYHKGNLIATDKEIYEALKSVIFEYRCTKCKGEL